MNRESQKINKNLQSHIYVYVIFYCDIQSFTKILKGKIYIF